MKGKRPGQSRFPTARIKKIMQGDDDVGKVASNTPVVISKALELFLEDILVDSATIVRDTGGKKLMPHHLKRLFTTNPQYDFLEDLVRNVKDPLTVDGGAGGAGGGGGGKKGKGKASNGASGGGGGSGSKKGEKKQVGETEASTVAPPQQQQQKKEESEEDDSDEEMDDDDEDDEDED